MCLRKLDSQADSGLPEAFLGRPNGDPGSPPRYVAVKVQPMGAVRVEIPYDIDTTSATWHGIVA